MEDKQCPKCGGETWDNRAKKAKGEFNPKAPDYSCKDKTCGGVIWPPKDNRPRTVGEYEAEATNRVAEVAREFDSAVAKPAVDWAEKDRRIQRQHSQEMAIRWVALRIEAAKISETKEHVSLEQVKELTDHFMSDLENET